MEDWQERVVQEKKELDEKLEKLVEFINSNKLDLLDSRQAALLLEQQVVMHTYSHILEQRIKAMHLT